MKEETQKEKEKLWFSCPICGQKLAKVIHPAGGVFIKCKNCQQEVEVKA